MDSPRDAIEAAERDGTFDLFVAAPAALAEQHGLRHTRVGEAACVAAGALPGNRMFNHVLGLTDAAAIDEISGWYEGDDWFVAVADGAVAPALEERGFSPDYAWAKFARRPTDPPEANTDLRLELVGPEHGHELGRIAAQAFDFPDWAQGWLAALPGREGWHCFVAFDGDQAAATGSLFVSEGVGWCSIGATDQRFRRRGAQGALLAARIRHAGDLGCDWVTTETGEALEGRPSNSYRNITRAGFEEIYVRPNYRAP